MKHVLNNPTKPELFSEAQLALARQAYAKIETCHSDMLDQFHRMFGQMTDSQLLQLAKAQIKFVSKLAVNACVRRNLQLA